MMGTLKDVWITHQDCKLVSLSLESKNVKEKHMRVKVYQAEFPDVPSEKYPLRHTVSVSLLDEDDLRMILKGICKYLKYDVMID